MCEIRELFASEDAHLPRRLAATMLNRAQAVTLTFAGWNQIGEWLRRFDTLRQAG